MTAPTPQEAVTGWIIIGTALCFAFALACIASDHMLPWIAARWRNRRRDPWDYRCQESPECLLERDHDGLCDCQEYD